MSSFFSERKSSYSQSKSVNKLRFEGWDGGNRLKPGSMTSRKEISNCKDICMNQPGRHKEEWTKRRGWVSSQQWGRQSVSQFSCSVVSNSLWPHGLQHTRLPCHQLPELAQTHVHRVADAIQLSHPLPSPSLPAFNLSQHQGLFQEVSSSHQVAKVLEFQLQHQSFQWIFRTDFLEDGLFGSPCSPRNSQQSSPTPQFKSINSLALSFLYSTTLTSTHDYWKIHSFH